LQKVFFRESSHSFPKRPPPQFRGKDNAQLLSTSIQHYQKAQTVLDGLSVGESGEKSVHLQYVAKAIDKLAAKDAIFTCDIDTPTIWAARYLTMNGNRRLLGSFSPG
jgi:pyruvate dehydrogenase (quinone)